jgi:hypothetical protein
MQKVEAAPSVAIEPLAPMIADAELDTMLALVNGVRFDPNAV